MTIENPFYVDPPYKDPNTIGEMAANAQVDIHNRAEAGAITGDEAYLQMHALDESLVRAGDGWFDRYGPPPPELDFLYEGEERYWDVKPEDRK